MFVLKMYLVSLNSFIKKVYFYLVVPLALVGLFFPGVPHVLVVPLDQGAPGTLSLPVFLEVQEVLI